MTKKIRQCKGCHGINDETHLDVPMGSERCTLDHDNRCQGGIVGGPDSKGRIWRSCPSEYVSMGGKEDFVGHSSDSDSIVVSDDETQSWGMRQGHVIRPPVYSASSTNSSVTSSISILASLVSTTITTSSTSQAPIASPRESTLEEEREVLDRIVAERVAF